LATDIAARGVHVSNISFVVNYDFPGNMEQYVHRCGRAGRNGHSAVSSADSKLPPVVYSFFTRNLVSLAPDLVGLLQASNAWVDPNLQALANESGTKSKTRNVVSKTNSSAVTTGSPEQKDASAGIEENQQEECVDKGDTFADEEEDEFSELTGKRIALKRASHVSDASSDSSDDEAGATENTKTG
jgi:superfamily II DNA/RNA helicase